MGGGDRLGKNAELSIPDFAGEPYTKVILKPPPPRNGTEPFFKRTLQQGGAQTYCHTHMVEQGGIHPVTAQGEMTNEGGGTQAQEL